VLVDDDLPVHVELLLAEHRLPADSLVLEVTEELFLGDRERAVAAVTRLGQAGVRVAVDDYGTGYSSLAYLQDLPVTELTLDRTFVAGMTPSPRSAAIVSSTVALAHALDLELVAEGVEDAETFEALTAAGRGLVQGHLFGRPAPAEQLDRLPDGVRVPGNRPPSACS
jgi:diguanylate cyclase